MTRFRANDLADVAVQQSRDDSPSRERWLFCYSPNWLNVMPLPDGKITKGVVVTEKTTGGTLTNRTFNRGYSL